MLLNETIYNSTITHNIEISGEESPLWWPQIYPTAVSVPRPLAYLIPKGSVEPTLEPISRSWRRIIKLPRELYDPSGPRFPS